jgi:hypothetical protein
MSTTKPIQKLADAVRKLLTRHIEANTQDDDARREVERDVRVRAAIEQMSHEGKLPPRASPKSSAPVQHETVDDSGANPIVVSWAPGVDIQGSKHLLRIAPDTQPANTYDVEDIWVVHIDPPCPIGLRQIVLRYQPRTFGPWASADQVLVCSVDDEYFQLDLAKARRQTLGWGLPTPDARRFARVSGPGIKITALEIVDACTQHVHHTIDIQQMLKPLAFDPTGRALACTSDSHIVLIDTLAGKVIEQILLAPLRANATRVSLPAKEKLLVYTGAAEPHAYSIPWFDPPGSNN